MEIKLQIDRFSPMTSDTSRTNTIKILLIDDDKDDYMLTKKMLKKTKMISATVQWVSSFKDALDACLHNSFDVVLVDYKMGTHNGIDIIRDSKKYNCNNPFILLTGIQDEQLGIKAIRLGAEDYLVKGEITPELLEKSILYSLERYQVRVKEQELREKHILEESEKHFRSLIENSADGIALLNKEGTYTYITPSIKHILGYSQEEALKMNALDIVHPEDKTNYEKKFNELLKKKGSYTLALMRVKHKNGSWRWIESSVSNMLHDPHIQHLVLNFRDVTTRVRLQQLKDEFLSIASHELKTPLTTIKGYIQLLEKYFQKLDDQKALKYIHQSDIYVDKLNQLISDLLDISRIQSGRMLLHLEEIQLCPLIKKTVKALQHLSSKHTLKYTCTGNPKVIADKERIEQVLTNLISNAIKYSPEQCTILINLTKKQGFAQISVQDQGVGIPKAAQKHLFQRFYRVENVVNKFSGLGIGLYISKEIIERHKGQIWVESDEGKGSTFYFTLPLQN